MLRVEVELQRDVARPERTDDDVISVTPAIRPSERSSGVATVAAIVSGLAPGRLGADVDTVGKSIWGSGETGSSENDMSAGERDADRQ